MLEKPFYFIIVVWGARYREYFLEYCLPSLLAPDNIPALATRRRSKFLIATTAEDWHHLANARIVQEMQKHVEAVHIEIPPCPPGRSGCEHMNIGHKLACSMAYADKALALVLTPDSMVSNGSIARLQELASAGIELVAVAALRFGEEPFLDNLRQMGLIPNEKRSDSGAALTISGQQMASAAVKGLHPETLSYEWTAPFLFPLIMAAWWRVPEQDGIVLHSLSWAPLLLDYGAVAHHDISALEAWTIDGDYLFKNLGQSKKIHVIQDSDEVFLASWTPMAEAAAAFRPMKFFLTPFGRQLHKALKAMQFSSSYHSAHFDPLRRRMFFLPVRWHGRPLSGEWTAVERRAEGALLRSVALSPNIARVIMTVVSLVHVAAVLVTERRTKALQRLKMLLLGDVASITWLLSKAKLQLGSMVAPR